MSDFDPIRACREELIGLNDIMVTLTRREHAAEEAMSAAEADLNSVRKLRGFCQTIIDALRAKIVKLEADSTT